MKIVLLKVTALVFLTISTTACSTYRNDTHGTPSTGVRANVDLDVLGLGVDAGANVGLHATGAGIPVQGMQGGVIMQGGGRRPCAPSLNAMRASEELIDWASAGGEGTKRKSAQANAYDSGGSAGYSCSASNSGSSVLVNGQVVGQGGPAFFDQSNNSDLPWRNQQQGYRPMQGPYQNGEPGRWR